MTKGLGEGHRAPYLPRCVEGRRSVKLITIRHTVANISPVTSGFDTERAANLLRGILDIGVEVVNEILSYRQDAEVPLLPPKCYLMTFSGGSWAKVEDLQKCLMNNPQYGKQRSFLYYIHYPNLFPR